MNLLECMLVYQGLLRTDPVEAEAFLVTVVATEMQPHIRACFGGGGDALHTIPLYEGVTQGMFWFAFEAKGAHVMEPNAIDA